LKINKFLKTYSYLGDPFGLFIPETFCFQNKLTDFVNCY